MSNTTEPTSPVVYEEHAAAQTKAARKAACEDAGRAWQTAANAHENIGNCRIVRLNKLREAGEKLNVACGREQLLFTPDGNVFCRREILPHLPAGMDLNQVQACVHIANRVTRPVATVAEVDAAEKMLQTELELLGFLPSHRRRELQTAHARNLFSDFVNGLAAVRLKIDELVKEQPMETWGESKLDEFLEETQPVKDQIARAERLRLGHRF